MEKHSVSKLIGSPPGYVGHEEGGQLTERVKRRPYSVLLLDEIEKAHQDVYNILLQVFEDGQLTDSLGNTIDFKNTIIVMTSNIGARFLSSKKGMVGFQTTGLASDKKVNETVMSAVKKNFNPEFLNRLDEIIIFDALTDEDLSKIVDLLISQVNENLKRKNLLVDLQPEAKQWIVDVTCQDRSYGARPLRRAIQKYIEDPLSEALIRNTLPPGSVLEVFLKGNSLYYVPAGEDQQAALPLYQ
jgi:ATP-dependent Clp protease ATP-binding subunit ClpC